MPPLLNGMNHSRRILLLAAILGVLAVSAGAFGAHALRTTLEGVAPASGKAGGVELWQTATNYALFHAAALAGLAGFVAQNSWRPLRIAAGCWFYGALIFSGALMAIALGGSPKLGMVAPVGGLALIAGWMFVGYAAARRPQGSQPARDNARDDGRPRFPGNKDNRNGGNNDRRRGGDERRRRERR